jgi:hypothetical protein
MEGRGRLTNPHIHSPIIRLRDWNTHGEEFHVYLHDANRILRLAKPKNRVFLCLMFTDSEYIRTKRDGDFSWLNALVSRWIFGVLKCSPAGRWPLHRLIILSGRIAPVVWEQKEGRREKSRKLSNQLVNSALVSCKMADESSYTWDSKKGQLTVTTTYRAPFFQAWICWTFSVVLSAHGCGDRLWKRRTTLDSTETFKPARARRISPKRDTNLRKHAWFSQVTKKLELIYLYDTEVPLRHSFWTSLLTRHSLSL